MKKMYLIIVNIIPIFAVSALLIFSAFLVNAQETAPVAENYPMKILGYIYGQNQNGKLDTIESGDSPIYVAQNQKGNLYVIYTEHNSAIQVFDPAGKYLFNFGTRGNNSGEFSEYISGIAINDKNDVFVCDVKRKKILVFDEKGQFKYEFSSVSGLTPEDEKQDTYPAHISIGYDGLLYISDGKNGHVWIYNQKGDYLRSLGGSKIGLFPSAGHISFDKTGNTYVLLGLANKIAKVNSEGKEILTIGKRGSKVGQFLRPSGLATDSKNRVYIVDVVLSVIQVFDTNGKLLGVTKYLIDQDGKECSMSGLNHIFIGKDDIIYISEFPKHRITLLKNVNNN